MPVEKPSKLDEQQVQRPASHRTPLLSLAAYNSFSRHYSCIALNWQHSGEVGTKLSR